MLETNIIVLRLINSVESPYCCANLYMSTTISKRMFYKEKYIKEMCYLITNIQRERNAYIKI